MTPERDTPFACAICDRLIGYRNGHFLLADRRVVCLHCLTSNNLRSQKVATREGMHNYLTGRVPRRG